MNRNPLQFFDPTESIAIIERRLPHWSQSGAIAFITWRTWDSLPAAVIAEWHSERNHWLRIHGIDPQAADWNAKLQKLNANLRAEFAALLSDRWNGHLDACHGACPLRRRDLAEIVRDSLLHFDGDRYDLTDFVVMPNHVHLMAAFPNEQAMLDQCESWKHFTASKINRMLRRSGRFWQQDGFDHLVRSQAQFDYLRDYFAKIPKGRCLKTASSCFTPNHFDPASVAVRGQLTKSPLTSRGA